MRLIALLLIATMTSCLTTSVDTIQTAWPIVRAYIEVSGASADELELLDWAVASGIGLDTSKIEDLANEGILDLLDKGKIGPAGAALLQQQVSEFVKALNARVRAVDHPLVITRSSWATHPPSAIAARTYR